MSWLWSFLPHWMTSLFTPFWAYGLVIVAALTLVALYAPFHKIRTAAAVLAGAVLAGLIIYSTGFTHGSDFKDAERRRAEAAGRQLGEDARDRGERDAASGVRDPNDCYHQGNAC